MSGEVPRSAGRRELLARLRELSSPAGADRQAVPMRAAARPPRLVLLPPAGGELFCYTPLVRALPEELGVVGFVADPRDARTDPEQGMVAAAARIAAALAAFDTPFCLAGWSYGGVLAFEVARQLERDSALRPPVVLLDACYYGDTEPDDDATLRRRFAHDIARLSGQDGAAAGALLAGRPAEPLDVRAALAALGVELDLPAAEVAARYAAFRSAALALQCYRPPGPYAGDITLLSAAQGAEVQRRWRAVCTGRLQVVELPGDHYTLFAEPVLGTIAARVLAAVPPGRP